MSLKQHAIREMTIVGLLDLDADYSYDKKDPKTPQKSGNLIFDAVLELVETFSNQGHSGFSARVVLEVFNNLARYETLSPLTNNPDEWEYCDQEKVETHTGLWQSRRKSDAFSTDGGKTYYVLGENKNNEKVFITSKEYKG